MNIAKPAVFFFCFLLASSAWSIVPPLRQVDAFKAITIEGEDLPSALGLPVAELSLAAMVDGVMEPIPYQIDQYNTGGAVYFADWFVPLAGDIDTMDATDKLLFLYKDAGARRNPNAPYDGDMVAEILTRDRDGFERYVYLVRNSRLRSDEQYVRYSATLGLVETDFYALKYDPRNHMKWDEFSFASYVGQRPLDSMKLSLNTGILTSITDTALTNEQLVAVPTGERIGPIRTTTQLDFNVYLFGVSILQLSMQIHHYPKAILYEVRGVLPELRRKLLIDPNLTMALDANQLLGAEVRSSGGPKEPGVVDGSINEIEQAMRDSDLDQNDNWIWVSTKRNMDVLAFVDYLGDFNEPMGMVYEDDATRVEKPEFFPGQLPKTGFLIKSFPMEGFIGFVVSLFFSEGFEGEPEAFSSYARTLPDIEVRAL